MNSERIKEIQEQTAYPESRSVHQALLQVWNECEQELRKELYSDEETKNLLYRFLEHIGNVQGRTILNVYPKEWFEQFKNK